MPSRILLFTSDFVAVDKAPGVSLQTSRRRPGAGLHRLLLSLAAPERALLEAEPDLRLVHRLDRGTSGLVLLARGEEAHRRLSEGFARGWLHREYLGIVWGRWPEERRLVAVPLGPDEEDRRRMRPVAGGKPARTAVEVLAATPRASLLRFLPLTGRTHQIRIHAAASGHPLCGDDLYGTLRDLPPGVSPALRQALPARPLLHAHRLLLPQGEPAPPVDLTAPPPEDFLEALALLALPPP
ncbi:MAG: RluA family pseudouridine synthase [Acidobacteriota bacterium]